MVEFLIDFGLVAILIIGITALNGVVLNLLGIKLFGRRKANHFTNQNSRITSDWKQVGGTK